MIYIHNILKILVLIFYLLVKLKLIYKISNTCYFNLK